MIFTDKFEEKEKLIRPEFDKLLNIAWKNQAHKGDLLLIHVNGFYEPNVVAWNQGNPENQLTPYVVGPGLKGHSERTHYSFIHNYRINHIHQLNYSEYVSQFKTENLEKGQQKQNNEIIRDEEITVQIEMLIYLKFWEADIIIKKLYQFVRALNGKHYDWHFKVAESNRDKFSTGSRQDIIRKKIRDNIKNHSEELFKVLKRTYKTQVRNSIAHSKYSILGRNIHLNNYIKEDPHSNIKSLSFDDWVDMFHNTLVLHNEFIRLNNLISEYYAKVASQNNNEIEILRTEEDGRQFCRFLEYRPQYQDWKYSK